MSLHAIRYCSGGSIGFQIQRSERNKKQWRGDRQGENKYNIYHTIQYDIGISMLRIFMYMCNHEVVFAALTSVLSHKNGAARSG